MVNLDAVCDPDLLERHVAAGTVRVQAHGPYRLYNYTPRAVFGRCWDEASLAARGLIVDSRDGTVMARPFPKFFGPAEPDAPLIPDRPPVVAAKLDGSLGVAYTDSDGHVRIATRGSFDSDQANEANLLWADRYQDVTLDPNCTPLFEIIYPQNRIVVDYGDMRDLVLIAVIDNKTGADLPLDAFAWPGPVAAGSASTSYEDLAETVREDNWENREGFVARWPRPGQPDIRMKLKYPTYQQFHAWITGLTARRVWEIVGVDELTRLGVPATTVGRRLRLSEADVRRIAAVAPDPVRGAAAQMPEQVRRIFEREAAAIRRTAQHTYARYEALTERAEAEADPAVRPDRAFAEAAQRVASDAGTSIAPMFCLHRGQATEATTTVWAQLRPSDTSTALIDVDASLDSPGTSTLGF